MFKMFFFDRRCKKKEQKHFKTFFTLSLGFLCTFLAVDALHGSSSDVLTRDELVQIFGDIESVPEYSVFHPQLIDNDSASSRKRRSVHGAQSSIFEFDALGRHYRFRLSAVKDLVSPKFAMIARSRNQVSILDDRLSYRTDCAFHGEEEGYGRRARIALLMCGKLRGVLKDEGEELVFEPLPERIVISRRRSRRSSLGNSMLNDHIVYRRRSRLNGCSVHQGNYLVQPLEREALHSRTSDAIVNYNTASVEKDPHSFHSFAKESTFAHNSEKVYGGSSGESFYIETAVFVDQDLLKHMRKNFPSNTEEEVVQVVLAMINAVELLYSDPSLGHSVKYVLKRLELLYSDPDGLDRPHNIDTFLTKFCSWQHLQNPVTDSDPLHWDHALILTGIDLYTIAKDGQINSQVVGLAPVSGMCMRTSSCTVNEGRHFESVYVVAHEIGHNLGMRHDGLSSSNSCDPTGYLMSPTLGSGKVTWSRCSRMYLHNFLRKAQSDCLRDRPLPAPPHLTHEGKLLPGQRFTADQQCVLKYGTESRSSDSQPKNEMCKDLHCLRKQYTWTSHPALEGTQCGDNKWCQRGYCVEMERESSSRPSNAFQSLSRPGVLGAGPPSPFSPASDGAEQWGRYSECRSSCLYGTDGILSSGSTGVAVAKNSCRLCRPAIRYETCSAVRVCGLAQRLTVQDFADDSCARLKRDDSSLSGYSERLPVKGIIRCNVNCLTNVGQPMETREVFPDGTVCQSPTDFPTYCIEGFCTEFRCHEEALYKAGALFCKSFSPPPLSFPPPLHYTLPPHVTRRTTQPQILFDDPHVDSTNPTSVVSPIWSLWVPSSDCRFSCIAPSQGIQLVSRSCLSLYGCNGLNRNIQLCQPPSKDCERMQTPFEYASDVCRRYSKNVLQLSGIGMQLSSVPDDPDRGCTVACQDSSLKYRFYRVNGRDGWFPFGTECSTAGSDGLRAYCLNGKCLEFTRSGIPLRNNAAKSASASKARSLDLPGDEDLAEGLSPILLKEPLRVRLSRRDLTSSAHRIPGSYQDEFLLSLVDEINATFSSNTSFLKNRENASSIDFVNPLHHGNIFSSLQTDHLHATPDTRYQISDTRYHVSDTRYQVSDTRYHADTKKPVSKLALGKDVSGSKTAQKYGWLTVTSPCSVTCGEGLTTLSIICARRDGTAVDPFLCSDLKPVPTIHKPINKCIAPTTSCHSSPLSSTSDSSTSNSSTSDSSTSDSSTSNSSTSTISPFGQWLFEIIDDITNKPRY